MTVALTSSLGVFTSLGRARRTGLRDTARTAEALGFSTLWLADVRGDLDFFAEALGATESLKVASAVLSIWDSPPDDVNRALRTLSRSVVSRIVLGLGVSHPALAPKSAGHQPIAAITDYLDRLDDSDAEPLTRVLGANAPRMLACAGDRTAGAITQLVTPERTSQQRLWLGDGPTLATEVKVVVGCDRSTARRSSQANLANYLGLPSYQRNLRAQGFDDHDFAGGGSPRLTDALVAGPDPDAIRQRIADHRAAGADHIALHVLSEHDGAPLTMWAELAAILEPTS